MIYEQPASRWCKTFGTVTIHQVDMDMSTFTTFLIIVVLLLSLRKVNVNIFIQAFPKPTRFPVFLPCFSKTIVFVKKYNIMNFTPKKLLVKVLKEEYVQYCIALDKRYLIKLKFL